MKKDLLILTVLIPAAILMISLAKAISPPDNSTPFASNIPFPTISNPINSSSDDSQITPSASQNIEVLSPLTGDSVKSGFLVKGNARTFESIVNIRLLDSEGNVLEETNTTANAPDAGGFGPFNKVLLFQSGDSSGVLEVFQYGAKDGSEIDKVTIPLIFSK